MTPSCNEALLELIEISPRDRILELNCGEGAITMLLAARVPEGLVAATDPSGDAIRGARLLARDLDNVMFFTGDEPHIPWKDDFFSKALSHGLPASLADVLRVLVPGGVFYVTWESDEGPVSEWVARLQAAGFAHLETTPLAESHTLILGKKPEPGGEPGQGTQMNADAR